MMWVKICGIHDVATAREVAKLCPDAVGLNFFDASPRCVTRAEAAKIVRILPESIEPVGLFVNHALADIIATCQQCGLKTVQLHGNEPPETLAALKQSLDNLNIIRAFRIGPDGFQPVSDTLEVSNQLNALPDACLVDARVEGSYGGTGETVCWASLVEHNGRKEWPPLILAGGLTPENVAQAIETVRPWGVDVASGVETSPGKISIEKTRGFIDNAREKSHN